MESDATKELAQGIQITWEVPSEPVDGFVIRYGYSPEAMDQQLRVRLDELKEENDPEYGPVYRYTVADVTPDADIYVSLAAIRGDLVSGFSETMKEAGKSVAR